MIVFNAPEYSDYDKYFSNFAPSLITYDGDEYPTVEHAYQAQKATLDIVKKLIGEQSTPGRAKRMGRTINKRIDWAEIKYDVMVGCLREKFKIEEYREILLGTGDEEIVEDASEWDDQTWGRGKYGNGKNLLGKALMQVREEINGVSK